MANRDTQGLGLGDIYIYINRYVNRDVLGCLLQS